MINKLWSNFLKMDNAKKFAILCLISFLVLSFMILGYIFVRPFFYFILVIFVVTAAIVILTSIFVLALNLSFPGKVTGSYPVSSKAKDDIFI